MLFLFTVVCLTSCSVVRGAGMVNIQESCSFKDHPESTCSPQEEYWFWDSEFMTDQACRLTATAFYYGPPQFTAPMTFKALLEK